MTTHFYFWRPWVPRRSCIFPFITASQGPGCYARAGESVNWFSGSQRCQRFVLKKKWAEHDKTTATAAAPTFGTRFLQFNIRNIYGQTSEYEKLLLFLLLPSSNFACTRIVPHPRPSSLLPSFEIEKKKSCAV